jgi:Tripartite tricarboxylate transporter family receptor
VIDHRGGQARLPGTDAVKKSTPDGYTIRVVSASTLAISPTTKKDRL